MLGNPLGFRCECLLCLRVHVVTVPFSNVNVVCGDVFSDSDCEFVEPQTSLPENGEASMALECETEMNIEGTARQSCARSGQKQTHTAKLFKQYRESMRSRAPPPPERMPLQQTATWPGPPVGPPEVNDMEVAEQRREAAPKTQKEGNTTRARISNGIDGARLLSELDAVYAWTPREGVIFERMPERERGRTSSLRWKNRRRISSVRQMLRVYRRLSLECV